MKRKQNILSVILIVLSLIFLNCSKEKEKIENNSNVTEEKEITNLKNDLKLILANNDEKSQNYKNYYQELKNLGFKDKDAFEMLYCDMVLEKWANEYAKSNRNNDYSFEEIENYVLKWGVNNIIWENYKENDKLEYFYEMIDEIRSKDKDVPSMETEDIKINIPKSTWKPLHKTKELQAYDLDINKNGAKDEIYIKPANIKEEPFNITIDGAPDGNIFLEWENLLSDGYNINLNTLTEQTAIDLIDYDGDNIPELVITLQDEDYNACVYLFSYDKAKENYISTFNMDIGGIDYINVEKYGYSAQVGNGSFATPMYWAYINGKFIEVEYNKIQKYID